MDIENLLAELYKHKVVINIDKGKLKMKIPKGVSIDYLKDEIGKKKEEIIELYKNIQNEKQSIIGICDHKDYYPLSSAQRRMYLLQQMDLESIVYNMPYSISIGADADKDKIEDIFKQLITRHESFRTSFEIPEEEPVQYIHEKVDFSIEKFTIELSEEQTTRNNFKRAFDLSKAPLLRVAIVEVKGSGNLLLMDMHHIISDGVSHSILEQEFRALYSGEELSPLKLQYKDYSEWQNSEERQLIIKQQEDFWIRKFE
ncbi:MAG: non-ribosomal peptide synthetase, partial [Bacteroidales bacterium]|nr:non-ribosomal peptide synthetase [Bacteroidales bacterium]